MPRFASAFAVAVLATALVPVAGAAQDSFTGTWHATYPMAGLQCVFDLVMTGDGTYRELDRCGTVATSQSGTYRLFPNGVISRSVEDWTPKQRYIVGAQVGTGHWETNAKPSGGTFRYRFTSLNTMVWRDANFGGVIAFHRALSRAAHAAHAVLTPRATGPLPGRAALRRRARGRCGLRRRGRRSCARRA
jgi:hypothetical protein